MSLMLYLFFNADLIDAYCCPTCHIEAMGWVDDLNIVIWSTSASQFNPAKFSLICLADKTMRDVNLNISIRLDGKEVTPVAKCSVLGFTLDSRLNWNSHMDHIEAKTKAADGTQQTPPSQSN